MELTWCKIKSGFILEPMRRRSGRMLELNDGGRLDLKRQTGSGRIVCADEPEVNDFNHTGGRRIRGIHEVSSGHADYASTAGHGIEPDGANLIIVKPISAAKGYYRISDGEQRQLMYVLNKGSATAWLYDEHTHLLDVLDVPATRDYLTTVIFWGTRWYGWPFTP